VHGCGVRRAPRDASVGACKQMPVGLGNVRDRGV